jgi:hypothetical protein
MNSTETHFQSSEKLTYEALAIALEKAKTTIQAKDAEIEYLKADLRAIQKIVKAADLSPAMKEKNGMDAFKENLSS